MYEYIREPDAIERQAFDLVRECTDLAALDDAQAQVALRVVHTSGDPELVDHLRFSHAAIEVGLQALKARKPILCDVEMVRYGIDETCIDSQVQCHIKAFGVAEQAAARGESPSVVAMDYWQDHLEGSIAVIGSAPTALFRLLEMLRLGSPPPALVIGMPAGFVGAAEAKQALWDAAHELGLEVITLLGRQGGSSTASAAVNALGHMYRGIYF